MEAGLLLLLLSRAWWAGLQYSCLTLWWPSSEDKTSSDTRYACGVLRARPQSCCVRPCRNSLLWAKGKQRDHEVGRQLQSPSGSGTAAPGTSPHAPQDLPIGSNPPQLAVRLSHPSWGDARF